MRDSNDKKLLEQCTFQPEIFSNNNNSRISNNQRKISQSFMKNCNLNQVQKWENPYKF